jgi:EF-P beta-lysylation protein EpmB
VNLLPSTSRTGDDERPAAPQTFGQNMDFAVVSERPVSNWRKALADAIRTPAELCVALGLPDEIRERAERAARGFPLLVPRGFVAKMRHGDPADPLLRQVLPVEAEHESTEGYSADPLVEVGSGPATGVLHKYPGRALLVTTGACAIHCRYCFRRHFPYGDGPKRLADWEPALRALSEDEGIHEVLLSGGDPLARRDSWLSALADRLAAIPHLRRLRIHTRLPIVLPERVDDALLEWLTGTRLTTYVVVHANHPNEIDRTTAAALGRLVDAGLPVLNQSVLLQGVNDDVDILRELCERLIDIRVLPYYIHQLDRVSGAAHFEVAEERGRKLVEELARRLPGYAVPRYVREDAGELSKTRL